MAGEKLFTCRYAKHPTDAIDGVTHFAIAPTAQSATDPGGAGAPGDAESLVTHQSLRVTLYGTDLVALLALVGAAAANLVIGTKGAAGANEKLTFKNVYFDAVPQGMNVPKKDAPGTIPGAAITGTAQWGSDDTFATMLVAAADS